MGSSTPSGGAGTPTTSSGASAGPASRMLTASGAAVAPGRVALLVERRDVAGDSSDAMATVHIPLAQGSLLLHQTVRRAGGDVTFGVVPTLVQAGQSVTLAPRLTNVSVGVNEGITSLHVQLIGAAQTEVLKPDGGSTLVGNFDLAITLNADLGLQTEHVTVLPGTPDALPATAASVPATPASVPSTPDVQAALPSPADGPEPSEPPAVEPLPGATAASPTVGAAPAVTPSSDGVSP